jgi:hypothetical protein
MVKRTSRKDRRSPRKQRRSSRKETRSPRKQRRSSRKETRSPRKQRELIQRGGSNVLVLSENQSLDMINAALR